MQQTPPPQKKRPYPKKKNHDLEINFFSSPKFILQRIFLNYFVIFQYNSIAKFSIKHCFEHLDGYAAARQN